MELSQTGRGVNEPILSEYSSFELGSFFFWFGSSSSSNSGRAYILCSSSARQGETPVRDRTRVRVFWPSSNSGTRLELGSSRII
jgi:hypothetical protein